MVEGDNLYERATEWLTVCVQFVVDWEKVQLRVDERDAIAATTADSLDLSEIYRLVVERDRSILRGAIETVEIHVAQHVSRSRASPAPVGCAGDE